LSDHEIVVAFAGRVFRASEVISVHAKDPRLTLDLLAFRVADQSARVAQIAGSRS
jgi:hypothetical protein